MELAATTTNPRYLECIAHYNGSTTSVEELLNDISSDLACLIEQNPGDDDLHHDIFEIHGDGQRLCQVEIDFDMKNIVDVVGYRVRVTSDLIPEIDLTGEPTEPDWDPNSVAQHYHYQREQLLHDKFGTEIQPYRPEDASSVMSDLDGDLLSELRALSKLPDKQSRLE